MYYNKENLAEDLSVFKKTLMDTKQVRNKKPMMTQAVKRDLVKDVNEVALYLYEYYLTIAMSPIHDLLDDSKVAKVLGWTVRKTKENRLKLEKAQWIKFIKKTNNGITTLVFILGKDKVTEHNRLSKRNKG